MRKIISLTILPSRLQRTEQTIRSLTGQELKADEICVWLPKKPIRDTKTVDRIPDFLDQSGINVDFVDDFGSATKLIPALEKYWGEKQTIIVTADDDQIYPPGWFGGLIKYADIYKNACLGYRGKRFLRMGKTVLSYSYNFSRFYFGHKTTAPIKVDVITGNWGALYRVGFFTEEVFDLDVRSPMLYTDDIWFSGQLAKNKIDKYVVPSKFDIHAGDQWTISSLYEYNKDGKNNNWSIQRFRDYF